MTPSELIAVRKKVGAALRKKREVLDMNIEQVTRHCGLGRYTITRIEGGQQDYRFDSLVILSRALKELQLKKKLIKLAK